MKPGRHDRKKGRRVNPATLNRRKKKFLLGEKSLLLERSKEAK